MPGAWVAAIFAGVLLSAFVTEEIGIAVIFGGFVAGMIMPRHAGLTEDVTRRMEDFVVVLLLPMFFAYTGLKTNVGLLDRPILWWITGLLILVAIVGKFFGAAIAARLTGFDWRASAVIGTLMNTRGLTELIVLNLALEKGVISDALFAALVLMALVTTFMAGPLLKLFDPKNTYGAPLEEELEEARALSRAEFPDLAVPERSILVAPQGETELGPLRAIAEPLARSEPPRELILARLVRPTRGASARGALQTEDKLLREASDEVTIARLELVEKGSPRAASPSARPIPARTWSSWPRPRRWTCCSSTAAGRCSATPCRAATSAPCCATRSATWRSTSRARERRRARTRTTRWWCRSAAPSTTGRRSSWGPGSPPPPARR